MQSNDFDSLRGHFLVAMPALADPNFSQTVTCICEHNWEGAVGIVINRVHASLRCKAIFDELQMDCATAVGDMPVYLGGPVHLGEVFILHGSPFDWQGSLQITPTLAMSNTRDILEAVALGRGPKSFLISLGCAGWGPGQLESEIKENAWLTTPVFEENLFELPVELRWEEAVKKMGIDPRLLSSSAGHA